MFHTVLSPGSAQLDQNTVHIRCTKVNINKLTVIAVVLVKYKCPNQTFHYTHRIRPKRVTSLRCPSPRHSAKQHSYLRSCWSGG